MILNTLYGGGINRLPLEEFYSYLEYLNSIGISLELIEKFEKIVSNTHNENPYEFLDELIPFYGRTHQNVYKRVKNNI